MTKEEYYDEERSYEALSEAYCEQCAREEEEWDRFNEHGFRDEADLNAYLHGSPSCL